ncbi:MAG: NAD-dependent epimerase/dehydratase family protein, partial [Gammaproteobacteria bacterium]|nr:NAD-dependent epimerase/dehydratase family protein [Gammaproteobacteria bacterium]
VTGILFNHESPYRASNFVTRKIVEGALRCQQQKDYRLQLGDLSVARDWGWAEEYIDAMKLILRAEKQRDHVICTGRMVTLEYFVEKVFSSLDLDWHNHVDIISSLKRPSEIRISVGNPIPMKENHGWRACQDVDGVIRLLIEHFSSI